MANGVNTGLAEGRDAWIIANHTFPTLNYGEIQHSQRMHLFIIILLGVIFIGCHSTHSIFSIHKCKTCDVKVLISPNSNKISFDTIGNHYLIKGWLSEIVNVMFGQFVDDNNVNSEILQVPIEIFAKQCLSRNEFLIELEKALFEKYKIKIERIFVWNENLHFSVIDSTLLNKYGNVTYDSDEDVRIRIPKDKNSEIYCGKDMGFMQPIDYFYELAAYVYNPDIYNASSNKQLLHTFNSNMPKPSRLVEYKVINNELLPYEVEISYDHWHGGYDSVGIANPPLYTFGIPFEATGNFIQLKSYLIGYLGIKVESSIKKKVKLELRQLN